MILTDFGYRLTDYNPDYVTPDETESYPYDKHVRATRYIADGVPFIATNPHANRPAEDGIVPACGAMASMLQKRVLWRK